MKKSRFLSLAFGMIPGAGQMYLGYLKRGVSLMGLFALVLAAASMLFLDALTMALPVIWFYAFFDTLNLYNMSYDRYSVKDDYLFHLDNILPLRSLFSSGKRYKIGGICCILLGLYMLYNTLLSDFIYDLSPAFYYAVRRLPSVALAVVLIWFGYHLVSGKRIKKHFFLEDDLKEYGNDEQ